MFEFEPPGTKQEIASVLENLEGEITAFFEAFSDEEFFAPQGEYWAPAGHLRHLAKSVRAVAGGMGQPKVALLLFGLSLGGSRSFEAIRETYRARLAAGARAGRFGPSAAEPARAEIMAGWRSASKAMQSALVRPSESALDRYRLPHPLLGKLTLREMLFFTAYHNAHHANRVLERSRS